MLNLTRPEGTQSQDLHLTRRGAVASMFFAGYAVSALAADAKPITTDDDGLIVEEVMIPNGAAKPLPAYVARPKAKGRHPTILVTNEIFGIHAYIKDTCRRLAKAGFVAIAPDYFDRAGDPSTLEDFGEIRKIVGSAGYEQQMGDTGGALRFLQAQAFVAPEKLAITGFCWGGSVVWLACEEFSSLKAGAAWYGRLVGQPGGPARPWPADRAKDLKAPVLGLYGGLDQGIPLADVEAMRAALAKAGNSTKSEIIVYPESQHGFHADYRPSYDAVAAKDGWARMLAWFKANGVA